MDNINVIGMDMGDKNNKAVILDPEGKELERIEVACTPEAITKFLARYPGALLAIETGTHCRWVSRIGIEHGHRVLVGNARKLRVIWDTSRKNDWRDAEMLARIARLDKSLLHPVKLRDDQDQKLFRLVKARDILVKSRTSIVNQIRGFCKSEGVRLKKCSSESFGNLADSVPVVLVPVVRPLFSALNEISIRVKRYDKLIQRTLQQQRSEDTELLDSIAGVGPVTTAGFLAVVGDPEVFGDARDIGPFLGLTPRQDQSGDTDKQLRISKEGNQMVRRLLVTSANYIMGPFGKDSDLRRHGMRIAERGGKNAKKRAKVAVARKLAVVMLALLKSRTPYKPFVNEDVTA